jgi:uncharacterized membrane protein required for colicin V production
VVANIIVDLIIIGIVVAGAIIGICRGFFLTVIKPIRWFATLAIALALATPVANAIIQPMIEAPITNQISSFLVDKCSDITAETADKELPTLLKFAAGAVGIDVTALQGSNPEEYIESLVDALAVPAVHIVAVIVSFFILYFVVKILLNLLISVLNKILDGGLFGVVNKTLGCIFNTLLALIVAWAFTSVFEYFISLPFLAEQAWTESFTGGFVYKLFKSISPIDLLLSF